MSDLVTGDNRPASELHTISTDGQRRIRNGLALFCVLTALLIPALLPRPIQSILLDVGAEGVLRAPDETAAARWFDLFEAERDGATSFRWTRADSRVMLLHARRLGAPLRVTLRLCGCRPAGEQPQAFLLLDGGAPTQLPTAAQYRSYALLAPPGGAETFGGLLLTLRSTTFSTPTDPREVGVRLDLVDFRAAATPPASGWRLFWLAAGTILAAALVLLRVAYSDSAAEQIILLIALPLGALISVLAYAPQMAEPWLLTLASSWGVACAALARPRGLPNAVGLAALLVGLPLTQIWLGAWLVDDAYISFRYARNLVEGYGLVFNPGERVEGYTNFLWTLLMAGVIRFGGNPETFGLVLPLCAAQAAVALCYAAGRLLAPAEQYGSIRLLAAPAILAGSAPFLLYGARGGGMEMVPFGLLLLSGLYLLIRHHRFAAGALLGLAAMMRPEGVMVAGLAGAAMFVRNYLQRHEIGRRWWSPVEGHWGRLALGFLLLFGPFYAWRFGYYGLPLPNTFYVKVGASDDQVLRGLRYLGDYWLTEGVFWLFGLIGVLLLHLRRRASVSPGSWLLLPIFVVYTLYIAAVGGDWMPGSRFLVPILPILALLLQSLLFAPIAESRLRILAAVLLLAAGLFSQVRTAVASSAYNSQNAVWYENYVVGRRREVGRWLQANLPPETLTAVEAAGALPYYSRQPTLDILGLNDRHIAGLEVETIGQGKPGHEKLDIPYVLDRRPDVIPYFAVPYFDDQPRFQAEYELREYQGPEGNRIVLYIRRERKN